MSLRYQSKKRAKTAPLRRQIVADLISRFPACVRCHAAPSVDCHEVISRARRPGSHLDPNLITPLCRPCHDLVTQGRDNRFLLPSWTDYDTAVVTVTRLRGPGNDEPF